MLQSLALSALIQVLFAPVTIRWLYPERNHLEDHPLRLAAWAFIIMFLIPTLGGSIVGIIGNVIFSTDEATARPGPFRIFRRIFTRFFPPAVAPSMWDWLFTKNNPDGNFVIIEFNDKTKIGGVFAEGSHAITSPESHGVFLSQEWTVDHNGDLVAMVPRTAGIMVTDTKDIRVLRVLKGEPDEQGKSAGALAEDNHGRLDGGGLPEGARVGSQTGADSAAAAGDQGTERPVDERICPEFAC